MNLGGRIEDNNFEISYAQMSYGILFSKTHLWKISLWKIYFTGIKNFLFYFKINLSVKLLSINNLKPVKIIFGDFLDVVDLKYYAILVWIMSAKKISIFLIHTISFFNKYPWKLIFELNLYVYISISNKKNIKKRLNKKILISIKNYFNF